jgi:signal transduction histidine kinase
VDKITISNLDLRVNEGNGTDEIAQLAITFNRMLERLESAFEMQRSFVSNASHELRTPLTAITGQIEVSLMKKRDVQEYENILHSVLEDIKNLGRLSNNLLDLAKASSDISEIKLRELRIDELLWQAQSELKKRNPDYTANIVFDKNIDDETKLIVFGNEHLIRSALINVMDNACKFSGNKSVNISLGMKENRVQLQFVDEGMGIDKNEQDQIFQPFYRASNARNINGHGLGLSLTKKIVDIHKGSIGIKSVLTKGTVVTITFPTHASKL